MARKRWLGLAGCLTLICLLPACGNLCLNPQPEPPCNESRPASKDYDAGRGTGGADAGFAADASTDRASEAGPIPADADVDQAVDRWDIAPDAVSDATFDGRTLDAPDDAEPGDASDATPEDAPLDAPHDGDAISGDADDGAADGIDPDVSDVPSNAPSDGPDAAPKTAIGDGHAAE